MTKSYIISRPWGGACGIGHQFNNWLVAWLLADKYDLTFVHSPFLGDHTQSQIDMPVKKWENFLNFGHEEIEQHHLLSDIRKIQLPKLMHGKRRVHPDISCDRTEWRDLINTHKNDGVLFEFQRDQFIAIDWRYLRREVLQNKYHISNQSHPTLMPCSREKTNVAIHIRRGDISPTGRFRERWVDIAVYKKIIDQLEAVLGGQDTVHFNVFTDDSSNDQFADILRRNMSFSMWGDNIFEVFHSMVMADILITGQSAFSCLAAILSKNKKIVRPWGPLWDNFPNTDEFIVVDSDGRIDGKQMVKAIL